MKKILIVFVIVILIGAGIYFFIQRSPMNDIPQDKDTQGATTTEDVVQEDKTQTTVAKSVEGRDIVAYHYGTGDTELLFVGGIHGGYSWNTALVAYELMDYLKEKPDIIPANVRVSVIPVLNPDGLTSVTGVEGRFDVSNIPASESETILGRFNANDVDLNRNFDCDWQENGTWQNREVSGGTNAFSEPESAGFRDYVLKNDLEAVVVWYSAVGGVFTSNCHGGVLPETLEITNLYADASGYKAYESFNFYEITGDAVNWLAGNDIPAISVLLTNHKDIEWDKNKEGIEALLEHYSSDE